MKDIKAATLQSGCPFWCPILTMIKKQQLYRPCAISGVQYQQ